MARTSKQSRKGFSLIELVIVVVIIGIIAAIAIPRMSRGSQGAADAALSGNLSVLRNAVDLYKTEHGGFPGLAADGTVSATAAADFVNQLTKYSDANGGVNATGSKSSTHVYGPYLRQVPKLPVGSKKGTAGAGAVKIAATEADLVGGTGTEGWVYYPVTGDIRPNLADGEKDANATVYNQY
jgi:prepilin-type N-terminal cleavage/methylation domain-containing protein